MKKLTEEEKKVLQAIWDLQNKYCESGKCPHWGGDCFGDLCDTGDLDCPFWDINCICFLAIEGDTEDQP